MEYIATIVNKIIDNFDFAFMITVNVMTFLIIKAIDAANEERAVNVWIKRLILILSIITIGVLYKLAEYNNDVVIINSAVLTPVFWDWILQPILKKLGISYTQMDNYMK